jgi:hypothetical protein
MATKIRTLDADKDKIVEKYKQEVAYSQELIYMRVADANCYLDQLWRLRNSNLVKAREKNSNIPP